MKLSAWLSALCLLASAVQGQLPDANPVPRVQVVPQPDYQTAFLYDGLELTRYRFDPESKRTFWFPLQTTLTPSLVRMGHPHDPIGHRHHYGVWMTHSALNGVNFWDDEPDDGKSRVRGSIQHQRVLGYWDGDDCAAMMTLNHWVADRDGKILLIEKRYIEARPAPDATSWWLLVDAEFTAPKGQTATFEPSGFGLMSVRMAKTIGVLDGGGRILNSAGQVNEEQVFRQPAKWCDYSGRLTNGAAGFGGITLMNYPQNPSHPTAFHVRNDGWMCCCLSLDKPVAVRDVPVHGRWALWVHEGVPSQEKCEAMWQTFAAMPSPDMTRKP
ncbi:MAG: PmoA family protein [Roseimicrobium sp.]